MLCHQAAALGSTGTPLGCVCRCGALTGRLWGSQCTSLTLTRGLQVPGVGMRVPGRVCGSPTCKRGWDEPQLRAGGAPTFSILMGLRGPFWAEKPGGFRVVPPICAEVFKAVAVLFSATRCAQLSRVGSQPGSEVRRRGLGEKVIWFPAWALTHPCILPLPPASPPP